jgi:hypothetical protein
MSSRANKRRRERRMLERSQRRWERERIATNQSTNPVHDVSLSLKQILDAAMDADIMTAETRNALLNEALELEKGVDGTDPLGSNTQTVRNDAIQEEREGTCIHEHPPALAEWLLTLLVSKRKSEALLGDFAEKFHENVTRRGRQRAAWLYWAQVLNSIGPLPTVVCCKGAPPLRRTRARRLWLAGGRASPVKQLLPFG